MGADARTGERTLTSDGADALFGVVCTYRRPQELAVMLRAIERQVIRPSTIVIVDTSNGESLDGCGIDLDLLPFQVEQVRRDNIGPAGAFGYGTDWVLDNHPDAKWVVLFDDDDPPVTDDALARVIGALSEARLRHGRVGGVGLRGARLHRWRARTITPSGEGLLRVDHLHGGYMPIYCTRALREVGTFDPGLFWGFEELELGRRLSRAGFALWMDGTHLTEVASRYPKLAGRRRSSLILGPPSWTTYYRLRNLLIVLVRDRAWFGVVHVVLVRGLLKPVVNLVLAPRAARQHLILNLRAIRDALRGQLGQRVVPHSINVRSRTEPTS